MVNRVIIMARTSASQDDGWFTCIIRLQPALGKLNISPMLTMKKSAQALLIVFCSLEWQLPVIAQNCSNLNLQWQADIPSTCNQMVMTTLHDVNDLPYLYVANKEAGLTVYDISNITNPMLVASVPTTCFDGLHVMNLTQDGAYLYLALGNSFTSPQAAGMAIVNISDPFAPVVTDFYVVPNANSGGGIVKTEGDYAYLGAMQSGLVILNIADKNNIQFQSQLIPSISFPPVFNPNPNLYNARGIVVKNSIVYLCYDAGGIRIINCTDKQAPVETGRWCNPAMYLPFNHPKAYNNCCLKDSLLFVAVDYAGMEVLNVADTANISLTGWWNPFNAPASNWFTSPVHANEIFYDEPCNLIFLSTGKTDLYVLDVSNPAWPDSCNYYGGVANDIGTWGISHWKNEIYLSYICAAIPFYSGWTGIKILTRNICFSGIKQPLKLSLVFVPNPFSFKTTLNADRYLSDVAIIVYNDLGVKVEQISHFSGTTIELNRRHLPKGIYYVQCMQQQELLGQATLLVTD